MSGRAGGSAQQASGGRAAIAAAAAAAVASSSVPPPRARAPSKLQVATSESSGEKTAPVTGSALAGHSATHAPLRASHSRTVSSNDPVTCAAGGGRVSTAAASVSPTLSIRSTSVAPACCPSR